MDGIVPIVVVQAIIDEIDESSSSDSEEEEIIVFMAAHFRGEQDLRPRVQNYVETVVVLYTDYEFKSHFRMTRDTFHFLLGVIGPNLKKKRRAVGNEVGFGRNTIDVEKQLLLAIWVFCTPDSYRSVCDRFNVGRATALRSVRRVTQALIDIRGRYIKWPEDNEVNEINHSFERAASFPKVLGAVDGTHIKIAAPGHDAEAYVNRKNVHSIQLQAVCDSSRKFLHCFVGYPGSVHDQRIFRLSGLQAICNSAENFPNNSYLLGDSAYVIQQHLMIPYRNNGRLTIREKNFNYCHSATRMVVERSCALLKGRWRSLLDRLPMTSTHLIPNYIMACCVLHNICLARNDLIDVPLIVERAIPEPDANEFIDPHLRRMGIRIRNTIKDNLPLRNR